MQKAANVLILADHKDGTLSSLTRTLIHNGSIFADTVNGELIALLLGENLAPLVAELEERGVDVIVTVDHASLAYPEADQVIKVVERIATDIPLKAILLGHSHLGIEVGPALSSLWPSMPISNCTGLEFAEDRWLCVRPSYEGSTHIKIRMPQDRLTVLGLQLVSLNQGMSNRRPGCRHVSYTLEECGIKSWLAKIVEIIEPSIDGPDLAKARIIVGVGRGIQSPDNLKPIFEFAEALGGEVSCTRPLVDIGWLPPGRLVGLSGSVVSPQIYIALGISGAAQHLWGMLGSEVIIAINRNPTAPIFNYAHYGLIADLNEIIPLLKEGD